MCWLYSVFIQHTTNTHMTPTNTQTRARKKPGHVNQPTETVDNKNTSHRERVYVKLCLLKNKFGLEITI